MKTAVVLCLSLASCLSWAAPNGNDCNSNQPIVTDSCVTFAPPDVASVLANANCYKYNSYDGGQVVWTCEGGRFNYSLHETLYFPTTDKTVIRMTDHQDQNPISGFGGSRQEALNDLKTILVNLPQSMPDLTTHVCSGSELRN